jgi:hypothetical protein
MPFECVRARPRLWACGPWTSPPTRFRVQGSGFRIQGLGFRVQGIGFKVLSSGFRVQG